MSMFTINHVFWHIQDTLRSLSTLYTAYVRGDIDEIEELTSRGEIPESRLQFTIESLFVIYITVITALLENYLQLEINSKLHKDHRYYLSCLYADCIEFTDLAMDDERGIITLNEKAKTSMLDLSSELITHLSPIIDQLVRDTTRKP